MDFHVGQHSIVSHATPCEHGVCADAPGAIVNPADSSVAATATALQSNAQAGSARARPRQSANAVPDHTSNADVQVISFRTIVLGRNPL